MQRIENVGSGLILKGGGGSGAWNRKIREVHIYIYTLIFSIVIFLENFHHVSHISHQIDMHYGILTVFIICIVHM